MSMRAVQNDTNPYNFVDFADAAPWDFEAPHPDHSKVGKECVAGEIEDCLSGRLTLKFTAETPLFSPGGFPFRTNDKNRAAHRQVDRHFCRMRNAAGEVCYALPGSGIKGAVRAAFEAMTNSRFGVVNTKAHKVKLPYRRRVYTLAGIVESDVSGVLTIRQVEVTYVDLKDWGSAPPVVGSKYSIDQGKHT